MSFGGQKQQAGEGSQQLQANGNIVVNYNNGITEAQAHEIVSSARQEMMQYSSEASATAAARMAALEAIVVPLMQRMDLLGSLAEPAVQMTVKKAMLGASVTERVDDYEMLSQLIVERVTTNEDRLVRAGVNRAIEIVDQIDEGALHSLTLYCSAFTLTSLSGDPHEGISLMNNVVKGILANGRPQSGLEWLEHLDILDAVRLARGQNFVSFDDQWTKAVPGYVSVGVNKDEMEQMDQPHKELINLGLLVPHVFKPDFWRVNAPSAASLKKTLLKNNFPVDVATQFAESATSAFRLDSIDPDAKVTYMQVVRDTDALGQLAEWRDSFDVYFTPTLVGKLLARSNAQRLLPDYALPKF